MAVVLGLALPNRDSLLSLADSLGNSSSWAWIGLVALSSHLLLVRMPAIFVLRLQDLAFSKSAADAAKLLDDYVEAGQDLRVISEIDSLINRHYAVLQSYDLDYYVCALKSQIQHSDDKRWGLAPVVSEAMRACILRLAEDTRSVFSDFDHVLQIAGLGIAVTLLAALAK